MSALPKQPQAAPSEPMTIGQYAEQQEFGQRSHLHLHVVHDIGAPVPVAVELQEELVETTTEFPAVTDEPAAEEGAGHDDLSANRRNAWLAAVLDVITPRSGLYTERQPSVTEILRRARNGAQVPDAGFLRATAKGYGYGAAGVKVVLRTGEWIVDHPARSGMALVLLVLACVFPATRQIVVWLLAPFAWAHQALAD